MLERYLSGAGDSEKYPFRAELNWLLDYAAIRDAEAFLLLEVEQELIRHATRFGFSKQQQLLVDHFHIKAYQVRKFIPDDLFFASGNSKLAVSPGGGLRIYRGALGRPIITGSVRFEWSDLYDWNKGWIIWPIMLVAARWPYGASDLAELATCGARLFLMGADWSRKVRSTGLLGKDVMLLRKKVEESVLDHVMSMSGGPAPTRFSIPSRGQSYIKWD